MCASSIEWCSNSVRSPCVSGYQVREAREGKVNGATVNSFNSFVERRTFSKERTFPIYTQSAESPPAVMQVCHGKRVNKLQNKAKNLHKRHF